MSHLQTIPIGHPSIFEGGLSSTAAACPVVDELFPESLCVYFPAETDTVLLFSWAETDGTARCSPVGSPRRRAEETVGTPATGDAGVHVPENQQKDDPLPIQTISSILKVVTLQCPRSKNGPTP